MNEKLKHVYKSNVPKWALIKKKNFSTMVVKCILLVEKCFTDHITEYIISEILFFYDLSVCDSKIYCRIYTILSNVKFFYTLYYLFWELLYEKPCLSETIH